MTLHEQLIDLKIRGPQFPRFGLCAAVGYHDDLEQFFPEWPEFSGNHAYPVPSQDPDLDPSYAYHIRKEDMWNPDHPYGAARLRLLDFLIERIAP